MPFADLVVFLLTYCDKGACCLRPPSLPNWMLRGHGVEANLLSISWVWITTSMGSEAELCWAHLSRIQCHARSRELVVMKFILQFKCKLGSWLCMLCRNQFEGVALWVIFHRFPQAICNSTVIAIAFFAIAVFAIAVFAIAVITIALIAIAALGQDMAIACTFRTFLLLHCSILVPQYRTAKPYSILVYWVPRNE